MSTQNTENHQHNNVAGAPSAPSLSQQGTTIRDLNSRSERHLSGSKLEEALGTQPSVSSGPLTLGAREATGLGDGLNPSKQPAAPPPPAPAPTPPQPADPATQWRIDFMKRKQRAAAFFNQLTPEQQITLCEWFKKLSVPEIQKRIAAPAPKGWAVQISQTVLRRTRALFFAGANNAATEDMLDTLKDMEPFTGLTNLHGVRQGLAHSLHLEAMQLIQRDPKSKDLQTVLANIQRLAALEFKRQQLELQREKLKWGV
ncbi:MAG TPA: hypothetical protein VF773_00985 [Verrucomicrobiae bacterium]